MFMFTTRSSRTKKKLRVYSCKESALCMKPVWPRILYMGDIGEVCWCYVYVLSCPYNATHRPYANVCALYGVWHKSDLVTTIQSSFPNRLCLIQHMLCRTSGGGSAVGIATRRRATWAGVRNHQIGGDFLISKHAQTGSGAYPRYTFYHGGKAVGAWLHHTPPSTAKVETCGAVPLVPPCTFLACIGQLYLPHFTFDTTHCFK